MSQHSRDHMIEHVSTQIGQQAPQSEGRPSVNAYAAPLVERLMANANVLRLGIDRLTNGSVIVDAGIKYLGGLEAGRRIAEICLGGLGNVHYIRNDLGARWPLMVHVHSAIPVIACLGCQYAGWSLSYGEGKEKFNALGSGPGRALALKEPLFKDLDYRDRAENTALILEVDKFPPTPLVEKIANDCAIATDALTLILTPTGSLAGSVQVCARILEVALHKAHELGFPLAQIIDGAGSAPVAPPHPDFIQAMGRTNDAILFGGKVQLYVQSDDNMAQMLAQKLPSCTSRDYGRPFAEVFKAYDYDFFQIDPMLFSPAEVVITSIKSGRSFHAGKIDIELLENSFGGSV